MTEPTADVPTAPERDDLTAAPRESSEPTDQSGQAGTSGQAEQVDGGPAPAIIVLTEEALKPLDVLKPVDRTEAHADANTALATTLAELEAHAVVATGEITGDDPLPTLREEVTRLGASEVVVVTEPHAVEDTFHTDWASKAREALGVPVLHMYAGDWRLG